jgi:hypothetical protein
MNEGIVIVSVIGVVGVAYFLCAMTKHGTFDIGKCFTLLAVALSFVTGIFIFIHSVVFLRANPSHYEDAVWSAIAGMVLCFWSAQQVIVMFRELYAKKVDPTPNN